MKIELTLATLVAFTYAAATTLSQVAMTEMLRTVALETGWTLHENDFVARDDLQGVRDAYGNNGSNAVFYSHATKKDHQKWLEFAVAVMGESEKKTRREHTRLLNSTLVVGPGIMFLLEGSETTPAYLRSKPLHEQKPCHLCGAPGTDQCPACAAKVCSKCAARRVAERVFTFKEMGLQRFLGLNNDERDEAFSPRCANCSVKRFSDLATVRSLIYVDYKALLENRGRDEF